MFELTNYCKFKEAYRIFKKILQFTEILKINFNFERKIKLNCDYLIDEII